MTTNIKFLHTINKNRLAYPDNLCFDIEQFFRQDSYSNCTDFMPEEYRLYNRKKIEQFIGTKPELYQKIIYGIYKDGKTIPEISTENRLSIISVKYRLTEFFRKLRAISSFIRNKKNSEPPSLLKIAFSALQTDKSPNIQDSIADKLTPAGFGRHPT